MSAQEEVQQIIESARDNADRLVDQAISYGDQAQTAASTVITSLPTVPSPTEPDVEIPPFTPHQDLSAEFTQAFDNALADFSPDLRAEAERFLDTYFPKFDECLQTHVDGWICDTLENGGTGMNTAVENAIWQRSRERELLEASRQKDELSATWAARGFSFPPGMMAAQLAAIDKETADKASTHSRDVAIKQAEIEIENVRLAVEQGIRMRLGIIDALATYLKIFMTPWELAIEKAKALVDAKSRLWQSSAAYYSALIDAERLGLQYDELRIDRALGVAELTVKQIVSLVEARVHAAVSSAEVMGHAAAAALSSNNSLGKVGYEEVVTSDSE